MPAVGSSIWQSGNFFILIFRTFLVFGAFLISTFLVMTFLVASFTDTVVVTYDGSFIDAIVVFVAAVTDVTDTAVDAVLIVI